VREMTESDVQDFNLLSQGIAKMLERSILFHLTKYLIGIIYIIYKTGT